MSQGFIAAFWGLLAGMALVVGALIGYYAKVSQRLIAAIMAFGSGVLISALSFNLMQEAFTAGGFDSTAAGFVIGSVIFTAVNIFLSRRGAKHRKRSGNLQKEDVGSDSSGLVIAMGALLDGIPESLVIGMSLIENNTVSFVAVIAIFLSNLPEGLSSATGMKKAGRSARYIFGVWIAIALLSGLSSFVGYSVFSGASPDLIAFTTAIAAGAILTMLAETMIPEAFEFAHDYSGLITVLGFLTAFLINHI